MILVFNFLSLNLIKGTELGRFFNSTNTVLCAGLNGAWVRQNMREAKAAIAQTLEFVSSVVAARVSSMWGFGGNQGEGLHIMCPEFAPLLRLAGGFETLN